jgi:hypothetical protein
MADLKLFRGTINPEAMYRKDLRKQERRYKQ